MKKKVLIYGAGAIGRGYLPWVYKPEFYEYYFVEKNKQIRDLLNSRKKYDSYMTIDGQYEKKTFELKICYSPGEEINELNNFSFICIAVGPRNFHNLIDNFIGTNIPIICFENDSSLSEKMKKITGNQNVVFGIPDVITSNTASDKFLKEDPLSIITENGECFIDDKVSHLGGECSYISKSELDIQWKAKLYIHNTTHCIAAYLGNLIGAKYLHNSMESKKIYKIVEGAMLEIKKMLSLRFKIENDFLDYYSKKELSRFSNSKLYDPIARVAREPFRKLAKNERLIGAASLCLASGVIPINIIKGIIAAFCFEKEGDSDYYIKYLINSLEINDFLSIIIGLRKDEALFQLIVNNWDENLNEIKNLRNE